MPGRPGPTVSNNKDGSISINYVPKDSGSHEMVVSYNDAPVEVGGQGGPFRCVVDSVHKAFVTAYGTGLNMAASGKEASFIVVGSGVSVDIDGPQRLDLKKSSSGDATVYSYTPMSAGEYNINIKAGGKHIHGSPFSAKVSGGEGRKRSQCASAATSEIPLGSQNVDLANLIGTMKLPNGSTEPCLLKKMSDGQLGVASFTPKTKGTYQVEVKSGGSNIAGSPFKINVGDNEVASPGKVKVTGNGLQTAEANKQNEFGIDISKSGHGSLAVSIEGAHRSDVEMKHADKKHYPVSFKPHEPGMYLVNVRFADDHITGSPFMVNVGGKPSGRVRETVTKEIAPVGYSGPGNKCEFQLKIPGTDPLDMEALLTAPNGKTDFCSICDMPDNLFDIKFTPAEEGVHTVSLKHKGLHISGSPFQYTVGQPPAGGPHKVEIGGTGLEKGEVGIFNEFNIYTREAGGGELTVGVEGPSKAECRVEDRGHGYTTVSYKVAKEGEYGVHVKYNGEHVPDSPTFVYIAPESGDAKMVIVEGLRDRGQPVDKPVTFNVNLNGARSPDGAPGELKSYVDVPSGKEEDVFLQELDRDLHAVRFLPKENGIHYVSVKFNEAHIPGSPFPILIGKMSFDPALVLANGDGLTKGDVGKPSKFKVVTTNAGEGTLTVGIEGSSKVAITCQDMEDGYEFTYVPMAPGEYLITIKYSNVTIAGCPSMATVTGQGKKSDIKEYSVLSVETVEKKPGKTPKKKFVGDASKVVAKGNGLQKAFCNRNATFNVDTKGAGHGLLVVGLMTPKGNPVEELTYKKQRGTIIAVNYKSSEKGEHTLIIRWGQDEIPGSPFTIKVA